MILMIGNNNTMFHYTITGSKENKKNFLYSRLIKIILDNFLNKLRSEFGQENDLTENQGRIHEYIGTKIYYLIVGNIPLKGTNVFNYHVSMLLFTNKWTRPDMHLSHKLEGLLVT